MVCTHVGDAGATSLDDNSSNAPMYDSAGPPGMTDALTRSLPPRAPWSSR